MSARLRKQPEPLSSSSISEGHPVTEAESRNINVNSRESTALIHIKDYASLVSNVVFHFPLYAHSLQQFAKKLNLPDPIRKMFGGAKNTFDLEKDIPDLTGKVILVTGGNAGLGKCSVLEFVRHGAKVYMASRTESKARQSIEEIRSTVPSAQIEFLSLDLTSLSSIKHAADEFISKETQLHILLNNAGIMALPPSQTKDGFDIQWGTNHIGHALLTKLLLPTLLRTAQSSPPNSVRIVNLSSEGHRGARSGINFADIALATSSKWVRYGQSKLANILHAKALAKRYGDQGIIAVACHPGVIFTSLYVPFTESLGMLGAALTYPVKMFLASPEEGSLNQIALCTAEQVTVEKHGGKYFTPVLKMSEGSAYARDEGLADKLWEYTEEVLREKGY